MELTQIDSVSHSYVEARQILSNCWIYTAERGLRAVTLHGNGATLAVDGRRLFRWCILADDELQTILGYLYCAERPSAELRLKVSELARARFSIS